VADGVSEGRNQHSFSLSGMVAVLSALPDPRSMLEAEAPAIGGTERSLRGYSRPVTQQLVKVSNVPRT
jgi:hypothetical protein